jgi:TetR/AcrR family transcriptional regulator, regulator of mycofactocin system
VRNNQGIDAISHRTAGRPPATDHGTIERIAFDLFETHGFAQTRTIDIAQAAGISRRTLFRYFATKNDIPWGRFDESLQDLRATLFQTDPALPIATALREGIVAFNSFDPTQLGQHVRRMRIIFSTPELQAHAALKYAAWRRVVAEFVAWRLGVPVDAPEPTVAGHVALATSLSAYDLWLRDPEQPLDALIRSCSARSVALWMV